MDIYCFDASALMDMWHTYYPPDVFPEVWASLEAAIASGVAIAPKEVLREIEKGRDGLAEWAKQNRNMFVDENEELFNLTHKVAHQYPNLIDTRKDGVDADPWIVALAIHENATIVTHEKKTGHKKFGINQNRVKIPDVCDFAGIRRASAAEFLRDLRHGAVVQTGEDAQ